jgi:hypothetical protein
LAGDEAAMPAEGIEMMGVPFAEDVVRATIGRVVMVVWPRIEGEFIEERQFELGIFEHVGIGRRQDGKRLPDESLKSAGGDADAAQISRHRPKTLILIHFAGTTAL